MDSPTPEAVRAIWDTNAEFWDQRMGEGNLFHRTLVGPAAERLLALKPGESVIEFGVGNGQFSRRMADLGAHVLATEFSPRMLDQARTRTGDRTGLPGSLTFRLLDATDDNQLATVEGKPFDAAVCNMVLMDMIDIVPLFRSMPTLLKSGGRFVATIMHPVLNNSGGTALCLDEIDNDGEPQTTHSIRVFRYRSTGATRGLAMLGQPAKQWYFHRTLSELFNTAFAAGLVMDGIDEPFLPPDPAISPRSLDWRNFQEIPPVLGMRFRVP